MRKGRNIVRKMRHHSRRQECLNQHEQVKNPKGLMWLVMLDLSNEDVLGFSSRRELGDAHGSWLMSPLAHAARALFRAPRTVSDMWWLPLARTCLPLTMCIGSILTHMDLTPQWVVLPSGLIVPVENAQPLHSPSETTWGTFKPISRGPWKARPVAYEVTCSKLHLDLISFIHLLLCNKPTL